jgi:hypothetical protein
LLNIRRAKIDPRKECWFLLDTHWLNEWASFVEGREGCGPPGPLSTRGLLQELPPPPPLVQVSATSAAATVATSIVEQDGVESTRVRSLSIASVHSSLSGLGPGPGELLPLAGLEAKVDYRYDDNPSGAPFPLPPLRRIILISAIYLLVFQGGSSDGVLHIQRTIRYRKIFSGNMPLLRGHLLASGP